MSKITIMKDSDAGGMIVVADIELSPIEVLVMLHQAIQAILEATEEKMMVHDAP